MTSPQRSPSRSLLTRWPWIAVLAALAAPAFPQGSSNCYTLPSSSVGDLACLPGSGAGAAGAIAGLDIDGDFQPEIATLRGGTLYLVLGSEYAGQVTPAFEVASGVGDVCSDPNGSSFLFTDGQGLQRLKLFVTEGEDQEVDYEPVVTLLNSSTDWAGAKLVRAGKGPNGASTFFGVSSDQKRLFSTPASTVGATPTLLFQLGVQSFVDVQTLDWDGDPANGDEFATLTSTGFQIRQQSPAVTLFARAAEVPGDAIATARSASTTDAAVWVTTKASDNSQNLLVFHKDFSPIYQIQMASIPGMRVDSLAAGDLDGDKIDDLVLSSQANYVLRTIINTKPTISWDGAFTVVSRDSVDIGIPGLMTANTGKVLVLPLWNSPTPSGSTYADLALGLADIHAVRRLPGDFYYPIQQPSSIEYLMAKSAGLLQRIDYIPAGASCEEAWALQAGIGWGINLNANAIQVKLVRYDYAHDDELDQHTYTGPTPLYHRMYEYPELSPNGPIQGHWVRLPISGGDEVHFAQVRPVRLAANNSIQQAWSWALVGMTRDSNAGEWLRVLSPTDIEVDDGYLRNACSIPQPPGTTESGGLPKLIPHPILQADYPTAIPAGTLGGVPFFFYMYQ